MLHLLPFKILLTLVILISALSVIVAGSVGWIGTENLTKDILTVTRWSSFAAVILPFVAYAAWRWAPIVQHLTFPYLGGEWTGKLQYDDNGTPKTHAVSLMINHTLFKMELILDSKESTSRTLVVHANRDSGINRDRLYYIYQNERKEGYPGAGQIHIGTAVIRIEFGSSPIMLGDYFTELHRSGHIELARTTTHPYWKIWR
jgi:hypothetical protein